MSPDVQHGLGLALKWLRAGDLLEATLIQRLETRGMPEEAINHVVRQLQKWGFLDDTRALTGWIEPFLQKGAGGPAKLEALLIRKGLDESVARRLAEEAFSDIEMSELARQLLQKKKPKDRGQAIRYLLAQGVEFDAAENAVAGYFPDSD